MKRPALVVRPAARGDLIDIGDFIARDDRQRAATFVAEIEAVIAAIPERPESYAPRDDLHPGLRVARHGRYLIFVVASSTQVEIVRILHGARDLPRVWRG